MYNIFDTNCLLYNPEVLTEYDNVVIPLIVIKELDRLKRSRSRNTKYTARRASRMIFNNNIECKDFGYVKEEDYADVPLLEIAQKEDYKVYTKDRNIVLQAQALEECDVEYYEPIETTYTGIVERELTEDKLNKFMEHNSTGWSHEKLKYNQYIDFGRALGVYRDGTVFRVSWSNARKVKGIKELNRRQVLAYDLLNNPKITVACIWGRAGTGKTALAIKSALELTQRGKYETIVLSRPNIQRGKELGILPGEIEDKQAPYMQPFRDNISNSNINFEIQPLQTVKGRDIKNAIYIIDEAQDIPPEEIKPLVERISRGSKIIFTGDSDQIDNKALTPKYNGITHLVDRLKGQKLFGCIKLDKVERSETAKLGELLRV